MRIRLLSKSLQISLIAAAMLSSTLMAQAPEGRAGGPTPPPKQTMDLATAKKMVAAAEAAAAAANAIVSIAVVDTTGDLVYFSRMDGAPARAVTSSQGKARAALMFGMPTKDVQEAIAAGKPLTATVTAPPAGSWEITPFRGGLPVMKDGKIIAAIGVGGSAPANDEKFAQAGIDAALGK